MKYNSPINEKLIGPLIAVPVLIVAVLVAGAMFSSRDPLNEQKRHDRYQFEKVANVLDYGLAKDGRIPQGHYPADEAHLVYMRGHAQPLISSAPIYVDSNGKRYSLSSKYGSTWSQEKGLTYQK